MSRARSARERSIQSANSGPALRTRAPRRWRVRAATLTEFDGYFLFEGVAYGRYTVRPGKVSAAALRLDGAFSTGAAPGKAAPRVRLGTMVLKPLIRAVAIREEAPSGSKTARGPPGEQDGGL